MHHVRYDVMLFSYKTMSVLHQASQPHLLLSLQSQILKNHAVSSLTKSCHFEQSGSPPGAKRPCHRVQMWWYESVIVPAVWPQGGRLSQQLHWCGQAPTTTSSTAPFQMTTTAVGPVELGKAGLDFRDGVSRRETRRRFTHSVFVWNSGEWLIKCQQWNC